MKKPVKLLPVPPVSFSGVHVLVIDDSVAVRQCFVSCLLSTGAMVTCLGSDPVTALHMLLHPSTPLVPTIVFVDLILPKGDGLTVIRLLKKRFKDVPIIALSRRNGLRDRLLVRLAGAREYVVKPISPAHIITLVTKYLPDQDAWRR